MSIILVIDDSLTDRRVIQGSLQEAGFAVITAASQEEAKKQITHHKPDLIVLDIVLPDRSGFELCRLLKAADQTKNIPVIICSSKNSNMDRYWGIQQGSDAYLTKPVNGDELLKTVRKLL